MAPTARSPGLPNLGRCRGDSPLGAHREAQGDSGLRCVFADDAMEQQH